MGTGRRLAALLLAFGLIGLPAAVMRVGCVGESCRSEAVAATPAPFCSLPADLRALITTGTYPDGGRSPDAMAVAGSNPVVTDVGGGVEVPWPSEAEARRSAMAAPLWFVGRGIRNAKLPLDLTLDQVAPTLEPLLGLHRAHPDVRSGTEIGGVVESRATSPLVVLIVWKGIGQSDLEAHFRTMFNRPLPSTGGGMTTVNKWVQPPYLRGVHIAAGSATAGSLPLDPTAVEATIGTGGLPYQHGIIGTKVRNGPGHVVAAFGPHSPQPVIATLGDDLDLATNGRTRIGLIATSIGDMALTGDDWYDAGPIVDRAVHVAAGARVDVTPFLSSGWGADDVPDLLAVGLAGSVANDQRTTDDIELQVLRAVPDATVVVAGTGALDVKHAVTADAPSGTDTIVAGGAFVDRGATAVPAQQVVDALDTQTAPDGSPLYLDAFASYAVEFGEVLLMATRTQAHEQLPTPATEATDRTWVLVVVTLAAIAVAARFAHPTQIAWLRNLFIVFGSLLIEAMPFVAIGALASALIEVFVPASTFAKLASLPRAVQLPAAAMAGIAFPVCECGSVPVARRLARKGLSPAAAVTFMLAAPIVNPVVIASTFVAYRGSDSLWVMVIGRFTIGMLVAICVGWVIGSRTPGQLLRGASVSDEPDDHDEPRARRFFTHLTGDLVFMARFLIVGALIAATIQTFVPSSVVDRVATLPILSLLAMMALAFILSLCSESDAFVAASFTSFGPSAQLAFLVFGPMVDLKLGALYLGTYSKGFLRTVVIVVTVVTLAATLWVQVIWG